MPTRSPAPAALSPRSRRRERSVSAMGASPSSERRIARRLELGERRSRRPSAASRRIASRWCCSCSGSSASSAWIRAQRAQSRRARLSAVARPARAPPQLVQLLALVRRQCVEASASPEREASAGGPAEGERLSTRPRRARPRSRARAGDAAMAGASPSTLRHRRPGLAQARQLAPQVAPRDRLAEAGPQHRRDAMRGIGAACRTMEREAPSTCGSAARRSAVTSQGRRTEQEEGEHAGRMMPAPAAAPAATPPQRGVATMPPCPAARHRPFRLPASIRSSCAWSSGSIPARSGTPVSAARASPSASSSARSSWPAFSPGRWHRARGARDCVTATTTTRSTDPEELHEPSPPHDTRPRSGPARLTTAAVLAATRSSRMRGRATRSRVGREPAAAAQARSGAGFRPGCGAARGRAGKRRRPQRQRLPPQTAARCRSGSAGDRAGAAHEGGLHRRLQARRVKAQRARRWSPRRCGHAARPTARRLRGGLLAGRDGASDLPRRPSSTP